MLLIQWVEKSATRCTAHNSRQASFAVENIKEVTSAIEESTTKYDADFPDPVRLYDWREFVFVNFVCKYFSWTILKCRSLQLSLTIQRCKTLAVSIARFRAKKDACMKYCVRVVKRHDRNLLFSSLNYDYCQFTTKWNDLFFMALTSYDKGSD